MISTDQKAIKIVKQNIQILGDNEQARSRAVSEIRKIFMIKKVWISESGDILWITYPFNVEAGSLIRRNGTH